MKFLPALVRLGAALFGLSGCGAAHDAATSVASRAPAVPAPLPTATPPPPWSAGDAARIRAKLARDLANPILKRAAGIEVRGADGTVLYAQRPATPMIPASTLKVIVGATALYTLGPAHRMSTSFEALEPPDARGRLGTVWLVGSGDPVLSSNDLRNGVGALVRRGVRSIEGDLVVDATAFAGPEINPHWSSEDLPYGYAAGTSAISLDQNTVEFTIEPTLTGSAARVRMTPANRVVRTRGEILTSYSTSLHIDREPAGDTFLLQGRIAAGESQKYWEPLVGVPRYVGSVAGCMLEERGVAVTGAFKAGPAPLASTTLWAHHSPPMRALVRQMFVESNNHIAEQLLRAVGAHGSNSATEASGAHAERVFLQRRGVSLAGLNIVDGSGLADANRVTPRTLTQLLVSIGSDPAGRAFYAALPLAGVEGTVKYHQLTAAKRRVRAKSGHIGGVSGLAGFVESRGHGRISFAFLINDPSAYADAIDDAEDRALDDLSQM